MLYLKGHAPRLGDHVLSNLDWRHREADCSKCGRVTFKKNGVNGVTCTRTMSSEHRISEVDELAQTGYCRQCRSMVRVYKRANGVWACSVKKREVEKLRIPTPESIAKDAEWRRVNRERLQARVRERRSGFTAGDYESRLIFQGGRCAICHRPPTGTGADGILSADHCHSSMSKRGLLCGPCNRGLGSFDDDPERMARAVDYLLGHQGQALG